MQISIVMLIFGQTFMGAKVLEGTNCFAGRPAASPPSPWKKAKLPTTQHFPNARAFVPFVRCVCKCQKNAPLRIELCPYN